MKKRFSLLLAIVMVIAMVLPMLPMLSVPTVAADDDYVLAEIYVEDATTPAVTVKKSEFASKLPANSSSHIFKTDAALTNHNLTVKFVADATFDSDVQVEFVAFAGKTITVDGNGHTLTKATGGNPLIRIRTHGTAGGTVTFKNLNYNCSSTLVQYYGTQTINLENCVWVNTAAGGRGIANNGSAAGSSVNVKAGTVIASASNAAICTAWGAPGATWNVETGAVLMTASGTGNVINNSATGLTVNVNGGAIIGNVKSTAGTVNLNSGYMSGTATGATVAEGFVQNAVAGVGAKGYTTIDAALAAVKESATDATVIVANNATMKAGVVFNTTKHITIKSYNDATITIAKDDGTGVGNVFQLSGAGMTLTLDGVNLTGNAEGSNSASSCIFQMHAAGSTLNLKNVDMKDLTAKWFIINIMGKDGNARYVNIDGCTSTGVNKAIVRTGNDAGAAGNDHCNHSVVDIRNSNLEAGANIVSVSKGSTAAVVVRNSTLKNTAGDVIAVTSPTNLVANSDSAKLNLTTVFYDEASVFTPKDGSKAVAYTAGNTVSVGVIEATYKAGNGAEEFMSLAGAFAKASTATEDVVINLYKDATLSAVTMTGSANVTVNGDLGGGNVAKITYTGKGNMIRWNAAAGKTLTFKNLNMDLDASSGCVFQLAQQSDGGKTGHSNNLTLENVNMTASIKWNLINVMANDGGKPVVTITNSTINVTPADGGGFYGVVMSGNNSNKYPNNLDLNITNSNLTSKNIIRVQDTSTVDLDIVKSTLTATGDDAIVVAGTGAGSAVDIDSASTVTAPDGKRLLAITASGVAQNTPYDVVAQIVSGDTTTDVLRKDFVSKFKGYTANADTTIYILTDIDAGTAELNFTASANVVLTIDGDKDGDGVNAKLTGSHGGSPTVRARGTGKIVFDSFDYHKTTSNMMQFYNGIIVELVDCNWTSGGNCFAPSGSGTINVLSGTTITTTGKIIMMDWSCNGANNKNTFNIEDGAVLNGTGGFVAGNVKEDYKGSCTFIVNVKGGTITGAINPTDFGVYNISGGTITGNVTAPNGTTLNITGGTINGGVTAKSDFEMTGGKIISDNSIALNIENGATATVSNAEIVCNATGGSVALRVCNTTVTVSNSTITATTSDLGAVYLSGTGAVVVNDCTVTANPNSTFGAITDNTNNSSAISITVNGGKYTALGTTADEVIYGNSSAATVVINDAELIGNDREIVVKDGVGTHYMGAADKAELEGAEVRLRNDYTNGLRFVNVISKDLVDALKALAADGKVNYGTIVLPKEYLTKYSLTVVTHKTLADIAIVDIPASNGLTVDAEGNVVISSALVEIKGSHYDWEFVSIVYASYTDANGDTVYVYGDNTAETLEAKSVKSVSEAALADTQEEASGEYRFPYNGAYTKYSPSKIAVLEGFAGLREMPEAPSTPVVPDRPELHEHDYEEVVTPATCTTPGYTTYTCSCGHSYTGNEVPAGHKDADYNGKCDVCEKYFLPAAGEAFKLQLVQAKLGKTLYFTGKMDGYYYATGDYNAAVDVYIEDAEGGFNMYFLDGETKNYLYVVASGSYINVKYGATNEGNVWTFNEEFGSLETVVNGADYYIGTYNTYKTISASKTSYVNSGNVDKEQFVARAISFAGHEHSYSEATCTKLATCACGLTTGELADHAYGEGVPTDPTCTDAGYTTYTCGICSGTKKVDGEAALGHTTENGTCDRCGEKIGGDAPVAKDSVTFEFGANGSAAHVDGNDLGTSKTYTEGDAELVLTGMSKVYGPAYDAKGNSCIKLGTSSAIGKFTFTVADDVTEVVIRVAKYKSKDTKVDINGTTYTIQGASDSGEYDEIVIDTTTTKTVTLATVTGGARAMINSITYNYD